MAHFIVGIGEVLWDYFPSGKKLGGAPANFAYHVSQFGLDGLAISAVDLSAYVCTQSGAMPAFPSPPSQLLDS